MGEEDILSRLSYSSSTRQRSKALFRSYKKKLAIRVFRSSNLVSTYAPFAEHKNRASYRYDGLYIVDSIQDKDAIFIGDWEYQRGTYATFNLVRMKPKYGNNECNDIGTRKLHQIMF